MSSPQEVAIRATGLVREYAPERGVCGIDLEVGWGECFALLGRNGSGKSTLTRLLIGIEKQDRGEIAVSGRSVVELSPSDRVLHLRELGIALDTSIHWKKLSGEANASFVANSYRMSRSKIEGRLNSLFGTASIADQADDAVGNYSFGMRRKLSIVEALAHDPKILVLDEPTSGVDAHFAERLGELVKERSQRGLTTWIASNDPDWVAGVAGRVAFVEKGRISAIGTVPELLAEVSPYQEIQVAVESPHPVSSPDDARIKTYTQNDEKITIVAEEDPMLIPSIMEWIIGQNARITSVQVRRSSLRDAFLLKTGEELSS